MITLTDQGRFDIPINFLHFPGGEDRVLFKAPKTDDGLKNSARGLLRVEWKDGNFILFENQTRKQEQSGEFKTVFENGVMMRHETLTQIRSRLNG